MGRLGGAALAVVFPSILWAQTVTVSVGEGASVAEYAIQLLVLVTLLSLVPGLAMMITCFPFMVTVLAILRQGIGLQQSPPNMLIVSLALFLTFFVMEPVFREAWTAAGQPFSNGEIDAGRAVELGLGPFKAFMLGRVDGDTLAGLQALRDDNAAGAFGSTQGVSDLSVLIPAFLLSEIERAFQIGFLIFLPFLIIDLVVAAVLMSMGMMMVPPAIVSLPFKLAFFVVADGWSLITGALVRGYLN
ncbi:flagellar type III secretion system pore protein FliP [Alphaproteobacteria bacterium GH1-50]|uniref:Flagellar biosynthetic protein FliP n=1 Tax=Kangsaoukella pontilimi TaxID=2691042 RepID=A0A7C9N0I9_9RHOB|nr:flagellar type III secretion system pore protein FliP [Kangsaoukella pontilimi]